jgi:hypothetical protein
MWGKDDRLRKPFCALCHVARKTGFCVSVGDRRKRLRPVDFCRVGCRFVQSILKPMDVSGYLYCRICKDRIRQGDAFPGGMQHLNSPKKIRERPPFLINFVLGANARNSATVRTDTKPFHLRMANPRRLSRYRRTGAFKSTISIARINGPIRGKDIAPGINR